MKLGDYYSYLLINVNYIRRRFFRSLFFFKFKPNLENEKIKKLSVKGKQVFFGYYDKTPFSLNNNKILALAAPCNNRSLIPEDKVIIGYFDLTENDKFCEIATTNTWCWQMGCRLQWFPENENELIIYNTLVDGKYGSVIQNILTKDVIRIFNYPIYDIDKQGKWAITLNFSRLHRLRPGYGYVNLPDETASDLCPDNDGVWRIDLSTGKNELLISLKEISEIKSQISMDGADHYINHLAFNPTGNRFMFIHLWMKSGKRYSRLFTCDINGNDLFLLNSKGISSHYTWKNDSTLIVFTYLEDNTNYYIQYTDMTKNTKLLWIDALKEDGHPSFNPQKKLILTDTYPNKYSERRIVILDNDGSIQKSKSFFSPLSYIGELRCDLHPRWDRKGNRICFDSAHEGYRNLYMMNLYQLNE